MTVFQVIKDIVVYNPLLAALGIAVFIAIIIFGGIGQYRELKRKVL
ncbi:MAG: hypothetical protein RR396_03225 [Clostridiales bacterium]